MHTHTGTCYNMGEPSKPYAKRNKPVTELLFQTQTGTHLGSDTTTALLGDACPFLGFPGGSDGKNLPATRENRVQSLG